MGVGGCQWGVLGLDRGLNPRIKLRVPVWAVNHRDLLVKDLDDKARSRLELIIMRVVSRLFLLFHLRLLQLEHPNLELRRLRRHRGGRRLI